MEKKIEELRRERAKALKKEEKKVEKPKKEKEVKKKQTKNKKKVKAIKKKVKTEKKIEKEPEIKEEVPEKKVEVIEKPKKIKMKKKHKILKKEEIKTIKRIGGGSFIASGILGILVPAIFYIVLGDFNSFLENCALPFSTVDIGNEMIVNCTEIRLVYVISYLSVFFGLIFIAWGIAKKIIELKKSFKST